MAFNLVKPDTMEQENKLVAPVPKIKAVQIAIAQNANGTFEYMIDNNDLEFVVAFLNGLANKLRKGA